MATQIATNRVTAPHVYTKHGRSSPSRAQAANLETQEKKLHRAVIESSRPSRHRIREHLHPRRLGFHPPGRRHPKRRPARRPGAKTYRQHTAASRSKPAPPRNNPAARDGERESRAEQRGLPEAGLTAGHGERWTHPPDDDEGKETRERRRAVAMSWRNDLVRSGGGVWFWFCGTLSWPGLPRWRGEKQRQDRRGVPSCSRLTRNGAKPPSPRDVTAVGAARGRGRGRVPCAARDYQT